MDNNLERLRVMWGINKLTSPFVSQTDMKKIEEIFNKQSNK